MYNRTPALRRMVNGHEYAWSNMIRRFWWPLRPGEYTEDHLLVRERQRLLIQSRNVITLLETPVDDGKPLLSCRFQDSSSSRNEVRLLRRLSLRLSQVLVQRAPLAAGPYIHVCTLGMYVNRRGDFDYSTTVLPNAISTLLSQTLTRPSTSTNRTRPFNFCPPCLHWSCTRSGTMRNFQRSCLPTARPFNRQRISASGD